MALISIRVASIAHITERLRSKEISASISAPYKTYFQELKRIKSEFNKSVHDLAGNYSIATD